ncbi:MAG: 4-(cytidine 5'-diphospho)-2-C-methyl-D-erythritol kinase [Clostridiales bacterium]|nr:4-(cytidine 5'-diphospho)-2-C-methyl-D-erythritol kinase [Clostridiales bacterium]
MNGIFIKAYAKVNLTLDVVSKRDDGYHNLDMIMQSIDLWDEIILREIHKGIEITGNMDGLPRDEGNIAYRAAKLVIEELGVSRGIHITINKNIPKEAGLGGGSADCAAVISGLNRLWDLGLDRDGLRALGKGLGADVPFCLIGGTALAQGIGDILTPLNLRDDMWLVIIKPDFGISTGKVYSRLDVGRIKKRPDNRAMMGYLNSGETVNIAANMVNVLEEVTIPGNPLLSVIKSELVSLGALGSLMSGSGPSVYGIFRCENDAGLAAKILKEKYKEVYPLKTIDRGLEISTIGSDL